MKRIQWRFLLPVIQVIVAITCFVYGPHQYAVRAHARGVVNNPEYQYQNWPAPVERFSLSLNFPALTMSYPFTHIRGTLYENNSGFGFIGLEWYHLAFFFGVALMWYCIGVKIDQRLGNVSTRALSSVFEITTACWLLLFAVLCAMNAVRMIRINYIPETQVGAAGALWAGSLLLYSLRNIPKRRRPTYAHQRLAPARERPTSPR